MYFKRAHSTRLDRVVKLHLAGKFVGALYFVYPIFYQFTSHTMTPVQIGLFFSISSLCNFIADVPSSILADTYSRKVVALTGALLLAIAPLTVLLAHSFSLFMVAAAVYGVGGACINGTVEALVYDHKNVSKATFRRVNTLEMTFGQAGILVSAAVGGMMFAVNHVVPFIHSLRFSDRLLTHGSRRYAIIPGWLPLMELSQHNQFIYEARYSRPYSRITPRHYTQ